MGSTRRKYPFDEARMSYPASRQIDWIRVDLHEPQGYEHLMCMLSRLGCKLVEIQGAT